MFTRRKNYVRQCHSLTYYFQEKNPRYILWFFLMCEISIFFWGGGGSWLYAYQLSLLTATFEKNHLDGEPFRQRFAVFQDFCFSSKNKALVKVYSIILIDTHTWLLSIVVNHGFEFTRENESSTTFWGACRLKTVRGLSLTNCKSIKFGTYKYFRAQRLISENLLLQLHSKTMEDKCSIPP